MKTLKDYLSEYNVIDLYKDECIPLTTSLENRFYIEFCSSNIMGSIFESNSVYTGQVELSHLLSCKLLEYIEDNENPTMFNISPKGIFTFDKTIKNEVYKNYNTIIHIISDARK